MKKIVALLSLLFALTSCSNSTSVDENSVDTLLSKCKEKNIPLYLQGLNKESALYDSSNNLQEKGVNLVYNSTPEYAYATLMIKVNS